MNLCCIFNYAPLYRESIYKEIDKTFNAQFYFGREVIHGKESGIAKLDYRIFNHKPIEFKNIYFLKYFTWRTRTWYLPFKKYDTFLITGDFVYSYLPFIFLSKLLGKRVYAWGHGIKHLDGKTSFLDKFFYKNITGFFSYGEKGRDRLIELGFDSSKIHVIYNSLSKKIQRLPDLHSDIYITHFGNSYKTLLFVGRLTPQKKLEMLLRIHTRLNQNGFPCNLVIIGEGPERNKLEQLANQGGYNKLIWFYGKCYDENKNGELIYNADLCISPGNVGLTALHSLSYGTPVLSHDNFEAQMPEYECILEGKTGTLYKLDDANDLYNKIRLWLRNSTSRDIIRKNCIDVINDKWNSDYQISLLKSIISDK